MRNTSGEVSSEKTKRIRLEKNVILRKDTMIPVVNTQPKAMCRGTLPTQMDVFLHFQNVIKELGDPTSALIKAGYKGSFMSLAAKLTAEEIFLIYERANIPVISLDGCREKILQLVEEWKLLKRILREKQ